MNYRVIVKTVSTLLFSTQICLASDIFWVNPTPGNFSDGSNWGGGVMPGITDAARFGQIGSAVPFAVNMIPSITNARLFVDNQHLQLTVASGAAYSIANELTIARTGATPAAMTLVDGLVRPNYLVVGASQGGELNISGPNARIEVTRNSFFGGASPSVIRINNGGRLTSPGGWYGSQFGGDPTQIIISGAGSAWIDPGTFFDVFNFGNGTVGHPLLHLEVREGGLLSISAINLAAIARELSTADALVTGTGSTWSNAGPLAISTGPGNPNGSLVISDGGVVTCASGAIADTTGATGTVTVTGVNSRWTTANNVQIGLNGGTGTLTVQDGGLATAGAFFIQPPFGKLRGNGQLQGNVGNAGRIEPGLSAGILTINGPLTQGPSGHLAIEIGGVVAGINHDKLVITGDALLNGFLDITLINGFIPSPGQSFTILQMGQRIGQFQAMTGIDLGGGLILLPQYSSSSLTLTPQQVTGISISPDPVMVYRGFTAQASLIAQIQGGGTGDAGGAASWSIDDPSIATISPTGLVSGLNAGSTVLHATVGGFSNQAPLVVHSLPQPLATDRVSLSSGGTQGNSSSQNPSISGDGRFVVFDGFSSNLIAGDTNNANDVFVRDVLSGTTARASTNSAGDQASGSSSNGSISANGQFAVFDSTAGNLVANDLNNTTDVFVKGLMNGQTERVSVSTSGAEANSASGFAALSADGRYVVFQSVATNLVSGDTNGMSDVFLRDRQTGQTFRVDVSTAGVQANGESPFGSFPSISADGRFVGFVSSASNLVPGDSNNAQDYFIRDLQSGVTERISVNSSGVEGNGNSISYRSTISADGRFVVFQSIATNLVPGDTNGVRDCFLRDRLSGQTTRINVGLGGVQDNGGVGSVTISSDGRFAAFRSFGNNLVADDTNGTDDVFIYSRITGQLVRESVNFLGQQANNLSQLVALSADGRYATYYSAATNLAPFDSNGFADVFLRIRARDGDSDCDGQNEAGDLEAFVQILIDPGAYAVAHPDCFQSTADMNGDGVVNGLDIAEFAALFTGP